MRAGWSLLVLTVALAGCTGETPAGELPDEPCVVESADDYGCVEADAGKAPDEVAHFHDYWQGKDRAPLVEATASGGGLISNCGPWDWYTVRPVEPNTVFQGTARVEIDVELTDSADSVYSDPQLWVKTAADATPRYFADLTGSDSFVFGSNHSANDLPHSRLSLWEFHLFVSPGNADDPACHLRFAGTMEITAEIVRGLEIPLAPGHPDHWQNRTEITLFDTSRTVTAYQGGGAPDRSTMCLSGDCLWDPHLTDDGVTVPPDTKLVRVVIDNEAQDPLGLAHHGADTWDLTPDGEVAAASSRTFDIDVGRQGDGPYALQSLWEWWVYPTGAGEFHSGTYQITATAYRDAPA